MLKYMNKNNYENYDTPSLYSSPYKNSSNKSGTGYHKLYNDLYIKQQKKINLEKMK